MGLADIALSGLTPFTATLEGEWQAARETATYRQHDWRGILRADRAFVAVSLVCHDNALSWSRTRWPGSAEQDVRVTCSTYGPERQRFSLHLSVADAIIQASCEIANAESVTVEIAARELQGGSIESLANFGRLPSLSTGAWLVAASDARSARNHTWHLRSPLAKSSDPRVPRIFGGRRNGSMVLD